MAKEGGRGERQKRRGGRAPAPMKGASDLCSGGESGDAESARERGTRPGDQARPGPSTGCTPWEPAPGVPSASPRRRAQPPLPAPRWERPRGSQTRRPQLLLLLPLLLPRPPFSIKRAPGAGVGVEDEARAAGFVLRSLFSELSWDTARGWGLGRSEESHLGTPDRGGRG